MLSPDSSRHHCNPATADARIDEHQARQRQGWRVDTRRPPPLPVQARDYSSISAIALSGMMSCCKSNNIIVTTTTATCVVIGQLGSARHVGCWCPDPAYANMVGPRPLSECTSRGKVREKSWKMCCRLRVSVTWPFNLNHAI